MISTEDFWSIRVAQKIVVFNSEFDYSVELTFVGRIFSFSGGERE
jgi:hypothetical protein